MKRQIKKVIAVYLTMMLCFGITACGGKKEAGNASDNSDAGKSQETNVSGTINVKDYYTVRQEGYKSIYTFDTSVFDASCYDGKFTMAGVEVTFPLGSVTELQEMGIDLGRDAYVSSEEELWVNVDYRDPMIEPGEENGLRICYGQLNEQEFVSEFFMEDARFLNLSDEKVHILEADIDHFYIKFPLEEDAQKMAAIWGFEDGKMTVDNLIEKLGLPIYCDNYGDHIELYYYYGEYTLTFYCDLTGDDAGNITQMDYITSKYISYYIEKGHRAYSEYMQACDNIAK